LSKKRQIKNVQLTELTLINELQETSISAAYVLVIAFLENIKVRESLDLRERSDGSKPLLEEWDEYFSDIKYLIEAGNEWLRMVRGELDAKD